MTRKRSLLLLIGYGFAATLAIFYGLVERHSLFVTFVSFHLLVCLCIPFLHGWWEGTLRESWSHAWGQFDKRGAFYGFALGLFLIIGVLAGAWLLLQSEGRSENIRRILVDWDLNDRWIWLFSFYLVFVNSLLEELFWRGFVLQRMQRSLSKTMAIILSSFFYTLYHLIVATVMFGLKIGLMITFLVFGAGMIWGWMKGLFPAIYSTWFSHILADLGLVMTVLLWIY
ncbi:CPBP family intramembrane glutamic endopeptidase [uncultured Brevibacillus sp.]|uniref:CPBP family intramembrane glutamic endopeptidase n=1 Tax=uncultured Brevibacillus sp. TaxID=169970 RepID=UPI002599D9A5|nr:type II CAAX endopeptidase family protein [uncultured Brevibacillus sp.]